MQAIRVSNRRNLTIWKNHIQTKSSKKSSYAILEVDLLQELTNQSSFDNQLNVTSLLYRDASIFEAAQQLEKNNWLLGNENLHKPVILSDILSVSVKGKDVSSLKTPIKVINKFPENNFGSILIKRDEKMKKFLEQSSDVYIDEDMRWKKIKRCSYWDFQLSSWKTDGCELSLNAASDEVVCTCRHMTHFAVILVS